MSKKIISKIKRPHHKCSHRSTSVGNDSCLRDNNDDDAEYPSLCRCSRPEAQSIVAQESIEHQLRRLELINDNLTKHLNLIGENSKHDTSDYSNYHVRHHRTNQYSYNNTKNNNADQSLLKDEFGYSSKHYCDLVDSSFEDFRGNKFSHKAEYVKKFDNRAKNSHQMQLDGLKYWNREKCDNEVSFAPPANGGLESTLCSSITYFATPCLKKNNATNDRLSNGSDTSRHSSTGAQHLKIGIDLFNRNVICGVEYMYTNGVIDSDEDLAELFIKKKDFSKMRLFEFLTAKENRSIHKSFCNQLDLKFKTIPEILREYLKYSFITGEYKTMLDIVDVLSHAYISQHCEGTVMGLNVGQVITIIQYLITFNANEQKEKLSNRIPRETFIEYLQSSLTEDNKISRQLASCLYWEICETPLVTSMDDRSKNLDKVRKMLTDFPKDFSLIQYHRYVICHVDLSKVVLPVTTASGSEKITCHDRTVFLFNDLLIVTKKSWLYESSSYRVKQIINLSQIKCSLVNRSASYSNPSLNSLRIVQIVNCNTTDVLMNFHSKLFDDLMSFYTSLDQAITIHKSVIDFYRDFESRSS